MKKLTFDQSLFGMKTITIEVSKEDLEAIYQVYCAKLTQVEARLNDLQRERTEIESKLKSYENKIQAIDNPDQPNAESLSRGIRLFGGLPWAAKGKAVLEDRKLVMTAGEIWEVLIKLGAAGEADNPSSLYAGLKAWVDGGKLRRVTLEDEFYYGLNYWFANDGELLDEYDPRSPF
jgi:hypothetical protein